MPLYEYECNECGRRTEVLQGYNDPPPAACLECGGSMRRLPSAPAVQFKGTGWYVTDYAGKGKGPSGESGKGSTSGSDSAASEGSDESKASKKSDAAKETTSPTAGSSAKDTKSASGASD
jgi:putative FmdB family regulatory protein